MTRKRIFKYIVWLILITFSLISIIAPGILSLILQQRIQHFFAVNPQQISNTVRLVLIQYDRGYFSSHATFDAQIFSPSRAQLLYNGPLTLTIHHAPFTRSGVNIVKAQLLSNPPAINTAQATVNANLALNLAGALHSTGSLSLPALTLPLNPETTLTTSKLNLGWQAQATITNPKNTLEFNITVQEGVWDIPGTIRSQWQPFSAELHRPNKQVAQLLINHLDVAWGTQTQSQRLIVPLIDATLHLCTLDGNTLPQQLIITAPSLAWHQSKNDDPLRATLRSPKLQLGFDQQNAQDCLCGAFFTELSGEGNSPSFPTQTWPDTLSLSLDLHPLSLHDLNKTIQSNPDTHLLSTFFSQALINKDIQGQIHATAVRNNKEVVTIQGQLQENTSRMDELNALRNNLEPLNNSHLFVLFDKNWLTDSRQLTPLRLFLMAAKLPLEKQGKDQLGLRLQIKKAQLTVNNRPYSH